MAVRIRMTRMGKKHAPFYRIGAYERRDRRDGRALENLGWYNPLRDKEEEKFKLNLERINYWISVGAIPSEKVAILFKKSGIKINNKPVKVKKEEKK